MGQYKREKVMVAKSVDIDAAQGFSIKIRNIQFTDLPLKKKAGENSLGYSATVAVLCGDNGIVLIELHGTSGTSSCSWPINGESWSACDAGFQQYVESQYESFQFLKRLVDECELENTKEWLQEHSTENSD